MREEPLHEPRPAPWHLTYLAVTTLGIGLLLGTQLGLVRLHDHLGLVTLGVVVSMFVVTSLLHWYDVTGSEPERWFRVPRR